MEHLTREVTEAEKEWTETDLARQKQDLERETKKTASDNFLMNKKGSMLSRTINPPRYF